MRAVRRAVFPMCMVLALAAVGGAIASRRAHDAAVAAAANNTEATAARAKQTAELELQRARDTLEAEVRRAADVPQLRAALADGVDAVTIADLFDTEDWWAPFRTRPTALIASGHILAQHGDRELPLPDRQLLDHARSAGVASTVLGAHPVVAAAARVGTPRERDATYLMFAAPFDLSAIADKAAAPLALSDGRRLVAATGTPAQQATLATLVGREAMTTVRDSAGGFVATALRVSPALWLWALSPAPSDLPGNDRTPTLLTLAAVLLGIIGVLLWRSDAAAPARENEPAVSPDDGAPPVASGSVRAVRATQFYERDDAAHRPTEIADSGDATLRGRPTGPLAAQALRVSEFVPDKSRVTTDASTFGRYRLIERLGEGGMAEIYSAVLHGAEGFRRVFVLKRLRPEIARNRAAVDQFIDEAKLGSSLLHPNIVPVFDFGKVGDEYFLAQEFIVGRDMLRLLQRHVERIGRPLDERLVLYVAHEVLDALAYAHNLTGPGGTPLGLVHRDISPGNVMVTARGEVKLFDFGIVKAEGRVSKTDVGVVKGNVSFMSPEQARGLAVDARSDLFSLGLVIYFCLTNDPLYPSDSTFERLLKAATGPKTEHMRLLATLPPISAKLLARALRVDPAARYQSAAEFGAEIAPHVVGARAEAAALLQALFGDELRRETSVG